MKYQGRISQWQDDRGFGFVEPNGGGTRAFVHISEFVRAGRRPEEGSLIVYEVQKQQDGRVRAVNIRHARQRAKRLNKPAKTLRVSSLIVPLFAVLLLSAFWRGRLPVEALLGYLAVSALAFGFYALDKSAARKGRWRISERTLHLLGLAGGWPGAYYARHRLRHKSSKPAFVRVYWVTVMLNMLLLAWLSEGQRLAWMSGTLPWPVTH